MVSNCRAIIDFIKISGDGKIQYVEGEGWSVPSIDCEVNCCEFTLHTCTTLDLLALSGINQDVRWHIT